MINLTKNSWHQKFYQWWWNTESVPNDLCNYFWGVVLALLSLPLFPGRWLYNKTEMSNREASSEKLLSYLALTALIVAIMAAIVGLVIVTIENPKTVVKVIAIAVICLIFYYIGSDKKESLNATVEFIKAKKNNYCPQINWKDKSEE